MERGYDELTHRELKHFGAVVKVDFEVEYVESYPILIHDVD